MDDRRFDAWTRRHFALASGGLLAALAGLGWGAEAGAGHHHHNSKKCKKNETRCGKKCVKGECCPGTDCGGGGCACQRATNGKAVCLERQLIACNGISECDSNADCETTERCIPSSCPGPQVNVCVTRCLLN